MQDHGSFPMFLNFTCQGLGRSRLDVEVGMTEASGRVQLSAEHICCSVCSGTNLLALRRCDDGPTAKAKAKGKAKARQTRARPAPSDAPGGEIAEQSTSKKRRTLTDPATQQRLDRLKLDSDAVKINRKWMARIKTLNVEASHSLTAANAFPALSG